MNIHLSKLFILVLFSLVFIYPLSAQYTKYNPEEESKDPSPEKEYSPFTTVKINPLTLVHTPVPLSSEIRLSIENSFFRNHSLNFSYGIISDNFVLSDNMKQSQYNMLLDMENINGYNIYGGYRYYYFEDEYAPEGFYSGLEFSYTVVNFDHNGEVGEALHKSISLRTGRQGKITHNIYLDYYFSIGLKKNSNTHYFEDLNWKATFTESLTYENHLKLSVGALIGIKLY
ncbi:MAG: hypothetical protein R6T91_02015 [Bacteroidales bacterium]